MVSSISAWELALSVDTETWLPTVGEIEAVRFVPMDNAIAVKSVQLPGDFHKNLADRLTVATVRQLAAPLVTADEKIRAYAHVQTIW